MFISIYIYAMFTGIALRITKQDFIRDAAQKNPEKDAEEWDTWTFFFKKYHRTNILLEHFSASFFGCCYMVMSRKWTKTHYCIYINMLCWRQVKKKKKKVKVRRMFLMMVSTGAWQISLVFSSTFHISNLQQTQCIDPQNFGTIIIFFLVLWASRKTNYSKHTYVWGVRTFSSRASGLWIDWIFGSFVNRWLMSNGEFELRHGAWQLELSPMKSNDNPILIAISFHCHPIPQEISHKSIVHMAWNDEFSWVPNGFIIPESKYFLMVPWYHFISYGNMSSYRMVPPSYKLVYKPHEL